MRSLIKLEELSLFFLSIFLFARLDMPWWWYAAFFLTPDLGMLGYLIGPGVGAVGYNVLHHKSVAVSTFVLGAYLANPMLQFAGVIVLGHSSLDRALGYGLKHSDSFRHTHLGYIGRGPFPDGTEIPAGH